ncbi:glycosyltransferase, partial [Streptomyces sp. YS-3]|uniref:glycosyltransferase n=1 Tax=Streptomyces sp. YS-3 TaxID=3381352 RepID=UPI0038623FC2
VRGFGGGRSRRAGCAAGTEHADGYGAGPGGAAAGSGYAAGSGHPAGPGYEAGPAYAADSAHGTGPGHLGGYGDGLHGVGAPASSLSPESAAYLAHCRALAAQLFPDEAVDAHAVGDNPVSFEEIGGPGAPELADAYASGGVVVLSSVVEGFPVSLVEAMFCGRATVSTDTGAVVEVIGGTGLVVPPRNPRALADACVALLRDPERRERLGAAARARALELFTVEQNLAAFRGIYLELMSHCPVRRDAVDESGDPVPFAHPAEAHIPGSWTALTGPAPSGPGRRSGSAHAEGVAR